MGRDNLERNKSGTGLGLFICKKLTEAMGGEIRFSSRVNHGTKFKFSFRP